jgi:hypothetical protein
MEDIKKTLEPLTDALPPGVRVFLDAGGWWLVIGLAALIVFLLIAAIMSRILPSLFQRKTVALEWGKELDEDLASYSPLTNPPGSHRLSVYHLPVRLRLVVAAPAGTETRVDLKSINALLDQVVPGLGAIAANDQPRIRIWPPQLSQQGFAISFQRHTRRPEREGQPSRWLLVAGRTQVGRQTVLLGLALSMEVPSTLTQLVLEPHQWLDVVRIKAT